MKAYAVALGDCGISQSWRGFGLSYFHRVIAAKVMNGGMKDAKMIKLLPILALSACMAVPASAQSPECAPSEIAYTALAKKYGEEVIFRGSMQNGMTVEIWTGDNTWSMLMTGQDGISCLVASGIKYERKSMEPNL